jgi:hypothetical protein
LTCHAASETIETQDRDDMPEDPDVGFEIPGLGFIVLIVIVLLIALWIGLNRPSHNFMQSMGAFGLPSIQPPI